MSNILLCHTNRVDASTLSNGVWSGALPLNNLKDTNIDKAARSTGAATSATRFAIDMGANFPVWGIALVNHNMSSAATWLVKGGTAAPDSVNVFATGQVFTSGTINVKQMTFNWDQPATWGARYPALYVLPTPQTVRYVTVDITDTGNTAGFVQLGRAFVGTGFQPAVNARVGLRDGWMDLSESVQAKYGKKFPIKRPRFRYVEFELSHLTAAEGTQVHELDDLLGLTDEVLYVPDPADMVYSQRYGMLGLMSELSPLDYPRYPERAKPYRIEQKL